MAKLNYNKVLRDPYKIAVARREAPVSGFRAKGKGYSKCDRVAWRKVS